MNRKYEEYLEHIVFRGAGVDWAVVLSDLCGFDGGAACDPFVLSSG